MMGTIEALSLAMGTAWTSGINLYATVAALGIAGRLDMIRLPQSLEVLTNPVVIAVACVMYAIEFFADKIPYVDNGWDVLHTFIRVPAGAILAARSLGDMSPALELAALLAGGSIALAAHGAKATSRLAINTSPEPFSNWIASFAEDLAVLGGIWIIFNHPWLMLLLVFIFLVLAVWMVPKIFRSAKHGFAALRKRLRGVKSDETAATGTPQMR
jgi:ABC-type multidrug transport system fused ATPase/permease subunit